MDRPAVRTIGLIALVAILAGSALIVLFPGFLDPGRQPVQAAPGDVLLSDDFSSPRWGTGTTNDSAVEYVDSTLQMILNAQNSFVWSPLNEQDFQNIHMEVTVVNNGTDSTTAFGLICNQQPHGEGFYFFAVTPAGEYAIAKTAPGQNDLFLTNEDQWGASDLISLEAPSYRIGADCGNGTLALYVDGQQIASVSDASYVNGGVALFTWSGEEAATTNVSFDDFVITQLP